MTIAQPWLRVRNPLAIPDGLDSAELGGLEPEPFAQLVRSNLMPRQTSGPERTAWDQLWLTLRGDALAERTYDVLEEFLDQTQAALDAQTLDPEMERRARKFADQCQMAWNRIDSDRVRTAPLQWAGDRASVHPLHSRHVIARLVGAITRHRSTVLATTGRPSTADAELWDTLAPLGLDPRDYPDQP